MGLLDLLLGIVFGSAIGLAALWVASHLDEFFDKFVEILAKVWSWVMVIVGWVRPKPKVVAKKSITHESIHCYYGGHDITKAVEDMFSPIATVIAAVEHQCMREKHASDSYRKDPSLIYNQHPWMTFVRTGNAEYLGWSKDYVPGPSPVEQRRGWTQKERMAGRSLPVEMGGSRRESVMDAPGGWVEPLVINTRTPNEESLAEWFEKGLLTREEMVPLILRADMDGRPIYAHAVPANAPKPLMDLPLRTVEGASIKTVDIHDPDTQEYLGSIATCGEHGGTLPCEDCGREWVLRT